MYAGHEPSCIEFRIAYAKDPDWRTIGAILIPISKIYDNRWGQVAETGEAPPGLFLTSALTANVSGVLQLQQTLMHRLDVA